MAIGSRTKKKKSLSHITIYNQPDCILPKSFFEGRFPPNVHPDSLDYRQWWDEQEKRCREGWKDGGYEVSDAYYYHLNFKKINMLDIKTGRPMLGHPYFAFEDQELFNCFVKAFAAKKGIILLTGRGFGKSFDIATIAEHKFTFQDVAEVIISASIDRFATLLWEKIGIGLNSQPEEFKRSLREDTKDQKQSGYREKNLLNGKYSWYDDTAFMRKVVYDSDPEKTRGTRPDIHIWEEVGSWSGAASLIDCYKKTEPSWWRGSFKTTLPIFIGTGGAMDTGGSIDAKVIFETPEEFDLMSFDYSGEKKGLFIPAYKKFTGHYEQSGLSDEVSAKKFLDERRESKKKNPALFRQETSEFPFNVDEVFQTNGAGIFPIDILENRYKNIYRDPVLQKMVQIGDLDFERNSGGKVSGVKWRPNPEGIFHIVEHPEWSKKEWDKGIQPNLYISGCDSFDAVAEAKKRTEDGKSPGSIFVFKRFSTIATTGRLFVCKLTQRTPDATEFYWNTLKANLYYNSRMLAEYTKIGIFQHYIREGFERLLYERPRLDSSIVKNSQASNRYGIVMPEPVKRHIISRYKDYLMTDVDQIYYPSLIKDNLSFTFEGRDKNKHDETMAAALACLADDDMFRVKSVKEESTNMSFPVFRRNERGEFVFD